MSQSKVLLQRSQRWKRKRKAVHDGRTAVDTQTKLSDEERQWKRKRKAVPRLGCRGHHPALLWQELVNPAVVGHDYIKDARALEGHTQT